MRKNTKFHTGQLVHVFYNEAELYEIVDFWEDENGELFYIIENIDDGMYLELHESEIQNPYEKFEGLWSSMTKWADMTVEEAEEVRDWNASFGVYEEPKGKPVTYIFDRVELADDMDGLLDQYNDYKELVEMFPDDEYYADMLKKIVEYMKVLQALKGVK